MTPERILEMLQNHMALLQAAKSLALSRSDAPIAMEKEQEIIQTEHTIKFIERAVFLHSQGLLFERAVT